MRSRPGTEECLGHFFEILCDNGRQWVTVQGPISRHRCPFFTAPFRPVAFAVHVWLRVAVLPSYMTVFDECVFWHHWFLWGLQNQQPAVMPCGLAPRWAPHTGERCCMIANAMLLFQMILGVSDTHTRAHSSASISSDMQYPLSTFLCFKSTLGYL